MKLVDMLPKSDQQLFVAGQKGSGKSTFIRGLLDKLPKRELTIVFDTKGEWKARHWWQHWKHGTHPAVFLPHTQIKRLAPGTYIFRPRYPEYSDPRVGKILQGCLKRGHCTIVIDELTDFSHGPNPLPILGKVIRQGRWKHVRMMIGTQRPAGVPIIAITEAVKTACFRLKSADDRARMAKWCDPAMENMPPGRHDFWWVDDYSDTDGAILIQQPNEQPKETAKKGPKVDDNAVA